MAEVATVLLVACRKSHEGEEDSDESEDETQPADSLSAAIMYEYSKMAEHGETSRLDSSLVDDCSEMKRKKYQKDSYFSDEEELE